MRSPSGRQTRREERVEERRLQLAQSALATLGELGYAKTSLREIAQNSEFTHGVVHYYFADKSELMGQCVRDVKASCITRYDDVVATATTREDFHERFLDRLVESLLVDATQHRLWYDIRVQSMYEEALRDSRGRRSETRRYIRHERGRMYALAGADSAALAELQQAIDMGVEEFQRILQKMVGVAGGQTTRRPDRR